MKGVLVKEWTTFDQLALTDIPDPETGDGEVYIRIQAAGISFATSLVVQGKYQRKPPLPFVPGTEVAGTVVATGAGVSRFRLGDRVCAVIDWGGLAEATSAKQVNVFALPDELDFARAITFTNSYATSCAALTWPNLLNVKEGDWLLVHGGGGGGVGIAAIEIGKILGATVIATAGVAAKLDVARRHGADQRSITASRHSETWCSISLAARVSMPCMTRSGASHSCNRYGVSHPRGGSCRWASPAVKSRRSRPISY